MAEVFRVAATPRREKGGALVVHCCSSAYQDYFEEFLHTSLGFPSYALLALPGGAQTLTLTDYLPKLPWAGWRWLKFLVDADRPARLVLIGHYDCRWYQSLRFWERSNQREQQIRDLRRAGAAAAERFPDVRVSLYYARAEAGNVIFESV